MNELDVLHNDFVEKFLKIDSHSKQQLFPHLLLFKLLTLNLFYYLETSENNSQKVKQLFQELSLKCIDLIETRDQTKLMTNTNNLIANIWQSSNMDNNLSNQQS